MKGWWWVHYVKGMVVGTLCEGMVVGTLCEGDGGGYIM